MQFYGSLVTVQAVPQSGVTNSRYLKTKKTEGKLEFWFLLFEGGKKQNDKKTDCLHLLASACLPLETKLLCKSGTCEWGIRTKCVSWKLRWRVPAARPSTVGKLLVLCTSSPWSGYLLFWAVLLWALLCLLPFSNLYFCTTHSERHILSFDMVIPSIRLLGTAPGPFI